MATYKAMYKYELARAAGVSTATLEAGFKAQNKYHSLFTYTVAQKYVKPTFA